MFNNHPLSIIIKHRSENCKCFKLIVDCSKLYSAIVFINYFEEVKKDAKPIYIDCITITGKE